MSKPSLNGGKTRPLSEHALSCLARLAMGPLPAREFNPGVIDRLARHSEALVEPVLRVSPYKKDRGAKLTHLQLTGAGHALLSEVKP